MEALTDATAFTVMPPMSGQPPVTPWSSGSKVRELQPELFYAHPLRMQCCSPTDSALGTPEARSIWVRESLGLPGERGSEVGVRGSNDEGDQNLTTVEHGWKDYEVPKAWPGIERGRNEVGGDGREQTGKAIPAPPSSLHLSNFQQFPGFSRLHS